MSIFVTFLRMMSLVLFFAGKRLFQNYLDINWSGLMNLLLLRILERLYSLWVILKPRELIVSKQFYKGNWEIVGKEFCKVIKSVFHEPERLLRLMIHPYLSFLKLSLWSI